MAFCCIEKQGLGLRAFHASDYFAIGRCMRVYLLGNTQRRTVAWNSWNSKCQIDSSIRDESFNQSRRIVVFYYRRNPHLDSSQTSSTILNEVWSFRAVACGHQPKCRCPARSEATSRTSDPSCHSEKKHLNPASTASHGRSSRVPMQCSGKG